MGEMMRREWMPGVWLRTIHTDKFKSAYLSITLMVPLEEKRVSACALLPHVLRRGSENHPDLASLSMALDQLYGGGIEPVVRKKGETQCIGFVASFLDDRYAPEGEKLLEPAIGLLGDLLLRPYQVDGTFAPEYVAGERANLIDRIGAQMNDKRRYATMRLTQLMCEGEAFGLDPLGQVQDVEQITPQTLWTCYQELLEKAQIEIYYCGSASAQRVEAALHQALQGLPTGPARSVPPCDVRIHGGREPRVVEEQMEVSQGKLALGFRTGGVTCWEPEYPGLMLCNALFGGSTLSKLFLNVREKLSLCYYASSMLEKMKGLILVSSGIEFAQYQRAKEEILAQLDALRQGNIEDWEMEGTRRTLIGGLRAALDSQGQMEEFWLGQSAAGLEEGPEDLAQALERVTPEEVSAVAKLLELDTIYFLKGQEG